MRRPWLSARVVMYGLALMSALWLGGELKLLGDRQGVMLPGGFYPVGRDFVVFYSAGRIITAGDSAELYDSERQLLEISRITDNNTFPWRFAYPAFFALPYVPLSALPYLWALGLTVVAFTTALAGGVLMLRSVSPTVRTHSFCIILALLAYQPVISQTFSGLNVGLTLLCLAGAYAALMRRRENVAGVWLGLLLFKPQFALPLLGLLAWRRQWRTLAAAAVTGGCLVLAAAVAVAPDWPLDFARMVLGSEYQENERLCCGRYHVSLLEMAATSFPHLPVVHWLVAGLGLLAVALTLRAWSGPDLFDDRFPFRFGLSLAVILAWSPHALFYETSLLIIPVIALVDAWRRGTGDSPVVQQLSGKQQFFLAALLAGGMTWPLTDVIHVQPMVLLPPVITIACWLHLHRVTTPRGQGRVTGGTEHRAGDPWLRLSAEANSSVSCCDRIRTSGGLLPSQQSR